MVFTNDYGTALPRSFGALRLLSLLNNWLHLSSIIIVLGISAYFINSYTHNTHLVYWLTIACIDLFFTLPLTLTYPFLALPLIPTARILGFVQWFFTYLWLTAFIFASQDYNFNGTCVRSPAGVSKCGLKRTLEAIAFLAFFTGVVGAVVETKAMGLLVRKEEEPVQERKEVEPMTPPAAAV
jgi:hypothetical protein